MLHLSIGHVLVEGRTDGSYGEVKGIPTCRGQIIARFDGLAVMQKITGEIGLVHLSSFEKDKPITERAAVRHAKRDNAGKLRKAFLELLAEE
jgi:hypothetical protein